MTNREFKNLLDGVTLEHTQYPIKFEVKDDLSNYADDWHPKLVRSVADRRCTQTGELMEQRGRWWVVAPEDNRNLILQTLLLAALTFEQHEVRDGFKYNGRAIFEPAH